jgi:hypothetical protein
MLQLQTELELKHQLYENITTDHRQSQDLLNSHIERLKDMLGQKSSHNE